MKNRTNNVETRSTKERTKSNKGKICRNDMKRDDYRRAYEVVVKTHKASISHLQRMMGIGYNHAAGLIDELETNGVIGPHMGSCPRKVLVSECKALDIGDVKASLPKADLKAKDRTSGFDGVIEGESNTIALAAAKRVATGPVDDGLNPLVLVGQSGTGKTRILNAIAAEIASLQDGRTVISITGQQFRSDYVNALTNDYVPSFRDKFKMADVLLVEGAEVFEESACLADEILPIIDDFLKNGKQVVIALTRPFKKSKEINRSFYGRIVSSATLPLAYPDEDMKRRYIKSYLSMKDATLPDSKIKSILKSSAKSFWEIKGAVCTALCENVAG